MENMRPVTGQGSGLDKMIHEPLQEKRAKKKNEAPKFEMNCFIIVETGYGFPAYHGKVFALKIC